MGDLLGTGWLVWGRPPQHCVCIYVLLQERAKLTSDRASVNEGRLQAQAAILQTQLESEIDIR